MSGEYGTYCRGYLWQQMHNAVDDFANSRSPVGMPMSELMQSVAIIAKDLCWYEASDSDASAPIISALSQIKNMRVSIDKLENTLRLYRDCMDKAVRNYVENKK